jgi:hypothetical protein
MTTAKFSAPGLKTIKYGDVARDTDSGAIVMWVAKDPQDRHWITVTLDAGSEPAWYDNGPISYGVSTTYYGWEALPVEDE